MNARARRRFDLNIWNNLAQFKSTLNFAPPEIVGNAVADPLWRRAVAAAARCAACGPSPCARRPSRTLRSATRPGVPRARTVFRACPVRSSADACVVRVESADNHPQRSSAVFSGLSARDAWPAMRTRARGAACSRPAGAAASVRGGSRDAGVAGARGIRAMLERRAPVRLRRRRPIVPPRSTKRTACRASAARRASSPAFRRARAAVALSPLSSTLSSLVR
ncbi:LuxR family transcriptional regulator [Burkholderia pseudomallei]|nr:autoinducer-binding transcriptional regulator, LuxR family domain protein [Burkholderia pseudomallei]CAJ2990740.1 LuxR family transcriptional regulator [Burkholderia pseudomallei]CAJ3681246.1 LuxR family transcriptional regulator [Burkholderia pseudomallei]CAJ3883423.1 LuxR family transcriptional regulator [Burkholderia pseudomallei]CAJ3917847.1 LuxR family transcriptional regulator [Burkholderia pseudomallei]